MVFLLSAMAMRSSNAHAPGLMVFLNAVCVGDGATLTIAANFSRDHVHTRLPAATLLSGEAVGGVAAESTLAWIET